MANPNQTLTDEEIRAIAANQMAVADHIRGERYKFAATTFLAYCAFCVVVIGIVGLFQVKHWPWWSPLAVWATILVVGYKTTRKPKSRKPASRIAPWPEVSKTGFVSLN